jgi:hypothetical protein
MVYRAALNNSNCMGCSPGNALFRRTHPALRRCTIWRAERVSQETTQSHVATLPYHSSRMLGTMCQTASWHNPEDQNLEGYVKNSSDKEIYNSVLERLQTFCNVSNLKARITGSSNGVQRHGRYTECGDCTLLRNVAAYLRTRTWCKQHLFITEYVRKPLYSILLREHFQMKKSIVLWDLTPCGSWKNRYFGGTYHLHLQGNSN